VNSIEEIRRHYRELIDNLTQNLEIISIEASSLAAFIENKHLGGEQGIGGLNKGRDTSEYLYATDIEVTVYLLSPAPQGAPEDKIPIYFLFREVNGELKMKSAFGCN
jgi:hypothetical protein